MEKIRAPPSVKPHVEARTAVWKSNRAEASKPMLSRLLPEQVELKVYKME